MWLSVVGALLPLHLLHLVLNLLQKDDKGGRGHDVARAVCDIVSCHSRDDCNERSGTIRVLAKSTQMLSPPTILMGRG